MNRALAMLVLLVLPGCLLGPDYKKPLTPAPLSFREAVPAGNSIANLPWWELFRDAKLQTLIREVLAGNKDLRIAAARIEEARAQYGFTRAGMWPSITYQGTADRINPSNNTPPISGSTYNDLKIQGAFSWELDVWGKYRRANEAARAELLASEEGMRGVVLTLVSEAATLYFELRGLDDQLQISRKTVEARRGTTQLIRQRFAMGTVAELDVRQAEVQEWIAAASIPALERRIAQVENILNLLAGRLPGPIERGAELRQQSFPPEIPPGLPSELLQRRPDVLAAEQSLRAQMARIGVAEALRWPSFSLTAALGLESHELSEWFKTSSGLWLAGGTVGGPLFEFGKNMRRVEIEKARSQQALAAYEKAVLAAFTEVESALVAVRTHREESAALDKQYLAAAAALHLSQARYERGVTSHLELLDSERAEFDAALRASSRMTDLLISVVQLYKVLGGGWNLGWNLGI